MCTLIVLLKVMHEYEPYNNSLSFALNTLSLIYSSRYYNGKV